ncbi:Ig-like domain-containing protein [Roseateles sp. P5_E11]
MLLAACGGGGGGDSAPPPTQAPAAIAAQDDALAVGWSNGAAQAATVDVLANDAAPADAVVTVTTAPKHGKAVVASGKVQYTPDDGYVGADSFDYRVDAGARTGGASARLTVEASFTLSGVVAPQLAAGYTVSAQAGAASAVQVQPSADRYSVTLKVSDLAGLVSVTATGAGEQKHVVIKSLVGEVAALAKLGGTIDEQRRPALRLDVFSVARTGLLQRAGAQPTTDAGLLDAQKRISDFDVLGMIGGLRNAIADRAMLPTQFATLADIATDPQALATAVQAAKSKDTTPRDWSYETSLKTQPAPGALIGVQGGMFAFIDAYKPSSFEVSLGWIRPNASNHFDLRADGTVGGSPGSDPIGTWARDGSTVSIKVNPDAGLTFGYYQYGFGWATRYVKQYRLEELPRAGTGGQPLFNLTVFFTSTKCSTMQHTCFDDSGSSLVALVAGFDLARDVLPFLPAHFGSGGRLFGVGPQMSPEAWSGRCLTCLGDGITVTGSPSVLGLAGEITEDGRWKLSGTNVATRFTRLLRWGNGIETWFAEYEANGKVIGSELIEATGTGTAPTIVATDQKLRRWLDMPAGAAFPFDWRPESDSAPFGVGGNVMDVKTSGAPAPTEWGYSGTWGWSDDGTALLHSSGRIKLKLLSKTRDGYIATYLQDEYPGELRVLTNVGPAR